MTDKEIETFIEDRVRTMLVDLTEAVGPEADPNKVPRPILFMSSHLMQIGIMIGADAGCPRDVAMDAVVRAVENIYADVDECPRCAGEKA